MRGRWTIGLSRRGGWGLRLCGVLAALVLTGAAAQGGYGAQPKEPAKRIAHAADAGRVTLLSKPRPHSIRDPETGRWIYGWRVCVRMAPGDRIGFFLMRGDEIVFQHVEPLGADGRGAPTVADLCGLGLPIPHKPASRAADPASRRDPLLGGG